MVSVAAAGARRAMGTAASAAAAAACTSTSAGDSNLLIRSLYRCLLRRGRWFDARPPAKALIPSPLPFSYQVLLGGRDRDFYTHDASVAQAIRAGFADPNHAKTGASDDMRIDLALQLNSQMSRWQLLLLQASQGDPSLAPPLVSAAEDAQGYESRYPPEARQKNPALDEALRALEAAQRMLESGGGDVDREAVKQLYRKSLALCPTADAHTYLGYLLGYDGEFEEAIAECEAALRLDEELGNAWNDLGLYLQYHREDKEGALAHFKRAQRAARYSEGCRHKPFLNAGHLLLEMDRPGEALLEYLQALRLVGPERGEEIRAVVVDMARVLTSDGMQAPGDGGDGGGGEGQGPRG